jgi:hypothetical protein
VLDPQTSASSRPGLRLRVTGLVVVALFGLLGLRLWTLQVLQSPAATQAVTANQIRVVTVAPTRGLILDRYGNPLVDNLAVNEITVSRSAVAADPSVVGRLAALTGEERYRAAAQAALPPVAPLAARHPTAFAAWLQAIDLAGAAIDEVAIVGDPADPPARALVRVATRGLQPHRVVAVTSTPGRSRVELLQSRFALRGRPTAFVCRGFSCRQPVTEPEALAAQLVE